ncbi:ankyrin repeat-containing protein BDA1-like [Malania oleifera]|uniref:ankyrin repeat-containing protein BDA1-like n=1 Tax=Malania oleifera TaxID=397392 RepID=UPI0025AEC585|nr:ankyrin repeat-containing protein BDA1-like [Malania oleifera]
MERMEQRLYGAAVEGSVSSLLELLQEDGLILDRVIVNCFSETPLHIAAMLGHADFAKEILRRKPELAGELDSRRSLPLHLASAKGNLEIVEVLLANNPDMCLACDKYGRNPLHLAVMKGRIDVLKELVATKPSAAKVEVDHGESMLHLCVRYNEFEALKLLVKALNDNELVNARDDNENTILHLAVADKQIETISFLLTNTRVEVNALNADGLTALDILVRNRWDVRDRDIGEALQKAAGGLRTTVMPSSASELRTIRVQSTLPLSANTQFRPINLVRGPKLEKNANQESWLSKKRETLMVVASLNATMAFQAGVNPPGGTWQDGNGHQPGSSIMAKFHSKDYPQFFAFNTIGFVASLSVILLLISGLPFKHRVFMWVLTAIMSVAVTSMAQTYAISVRVVAPASEEKAPAQIIDVAVAVWCGVIGLLLLGHTVRLLKTLAEKFGGFIWRERRVPGLEYINDVNIYATP